MDVASSSSSSDEDETAVVVAAAIVSIPPPRGGGGGLRPPKTFGWTWRTATTSRTPQQQQQQLPQRRRRYNICDATTGKRVHEKQHVVANQHPPNVTAVRIVTLDARIERLNPVIDPDCEPAPVIMAAGILFFSQMPGSGDGDTVFLLGREQFYPHWHDSDKWADFGGGVDVVDEDVAATAAREAWEESMGTIHTYEVLLSRLRNGEASATFDIQASDNAGCYRIYLLHVPYYDYNMMLSRFRSYLRRHKIQILDAEKTAFEWIDADHLTRISQVDTHGHSTLRPNFAKSVVEISRRINLRSLCRVISSSNAAAAAAAPTPDAESGQ